MKASRLAVVFSVIYPVVSLSVSWWPRVTSFPSLTTPTAVDPAPTNNPHDLGLSDAEHRSLFPHSEITQSLEKRPDCIRSVYHSISRCEEIQLNEEERARLAVQMTMCDVKLFPRNQVPMECEAMESSSQSSASRKQATFLRCLDAISRNAQLSAPYHGYLRELNSGDGTKYCYAARDGNEMEYLREMNRKSTTWMHDVLRHFNSQVDKGNQAVWQALVTESGDVLQNLQSAMSTFIDLPATLASEWAVRMNNAFDDFQSRADKDRSEVVSKISSEVDIAVRNHTANLSDRMDDVQTSYASQAAAVFSGIQEIFGVFSVGMDDASSKLVRIGDEIGNIGQSVGQVAYGISAIDSSVHVIDEQAQQTAMIMAEVSRSSVQFHELQNRDHALQQQRMVEVNQFLDGAGEKVQGLHASLTTCPVSVNLEETCAWIYGGEACSQISRVNWMLLWPIESFLNTTLCLGYVIWQNIIQPLLTIFLFLTLYKLGIVGHMVAVTGGGARVFHGSLRHVLSYSTHPTAVRVKQEPPEERSLLSYNRGTSRIPERLWRPVHDDSGIFE